MLFNIVKSTMPGYQQVIMINLENKLTGFNKSQIIYKLNSIYLLIATMYIKLQNMYIFYSNSL